MSRWQPRGFIGVVHLAAMPGDPAYTTLGFDAVATSAHADAELLASGGVDAIIIENFGSAPFAKGTEGDRLPPHQVALLARVARQCVESFDVPIGINCLRNDAISALGIAAAVGAHFIRVNVHTGACLTDQGVIEGEAHRSLRYRESLEAQRIAILADVFVKHAAQLATLDVPTVVEDTLHRGHADAVIVTGSATGAAADLGMVQQVAGAASGRPVLIGSGMNPGNAPSLAPHAHGAIIGSWLKLDGDVRNPVDPERVETMRKALDAIWD